MQPKRVGVISLGCDKNTVDTEKMLAVIAEKFVIEPNIDNCQVLIINTCAFLNSSRKEAIEEILLAIDLKTKGKIEKIIVTGCLPQKFIQDIYDSLPEVDAFMGVSSYLEILDVIDRIYKGERVKLITTPTNEKCTKRVLTTGGYAYLKIADGCDNHCTYCLIPKIRGKYRSVEKSLLLEEAKSLGEVKELILVAQDVACYGKDLTPKSSLVELIRELSALTNVKGIRLLYCYPENITEELIHEFNCNAKMIRYIDIPFQHADDRILKLMNRKGSYEGYLALINNLKSSVNGIAIRSTFITGFPQEDEQAFQRLVDFLQKAQLTNAGFFAYSREKDTPADRLSGHLLQGIKTKRLKKLYSVQKKIVKQSNKAIIGRHLNVTAEGFDQERMVYYGRAYFNAPNVDGKIYFFSAEEVIYGDSYLVKIIESSGYDLLGERI